MQNDWPWLLRTSSTPILIVNIISQSPDQVETNLPVTSSSLLLHVLKNKQLKWSLGNIFFTETSNIKWYDSWLASGWHYFIIFFEIFLFQHQTVCPRMNRQCFLLESSVKSRVFTKIVDTFTNNYNELFFHIMNKFRAYLLLLT
jgi:hypothetical protein